MAIIEKGKSKEKLVADPSAEAGKILGIEVADHIVVAKNGFFSFKKNKIL